MLAKGEERTRAASEKLKQDMARSVNSLASLDFSGKYDETVLLWGDSTEVSAADAGAFIGEIVPLGVRERRKIDASDDKSKAGGAAGAAAAARKSAGAQRPAVRVPVMHDFQFFDRKRVEELVARENEVIAQRRTLTNTLKVSRKEGEMKSLPHADQHAQGEAMMTEYTLYNTLTCLGAAAR